MREVERRLVRRKLDAEMKPFRQAARRKKSTQALLRAVRLTLNIPVREVSEKMGVDRSVMYGLEESERNRTITLRSLGRMAEAMGCRVVYGVVPQEGKTLDRVADERLWRKVLGTGTEGPGTRDQGIGNRE